MSPTAREALALADFDAQAGGLVEKLHTLRSEIDAALTKLASDEGLPCRVPARHPMQAFRQVAEAPTSRIDENLAEPLNELGVIGCILGLRHPL